MHKPLVLSLILLTGTTYAYAIGPAYPPTISGNTLVPGTWTLSGAAEKTFTFNNTLTLTGVDGSTLAIGSGGTLGTGAYATITNYAPLASPTFTGTVKITPTAAVTIATSQAQAVGGSAILAFASLSGTALSQIVSGTSIPLGTQEFTAAPTAQVTLAANGVSASGQKVLTTTATAGSAVGQQCIDLTTPTAIGAGNVIASIQAGVSITMTSNLVANTANTDSIRCDPTITLSNVTTAAVASGASITFFANASTPSTSSASYNAGDSSIAGNVNSAGNIAAGGSLIIGTSTSSTAAGSLYSDVNWGMIFKSKTTSPVTADFLWLNSANTERMRLSSAELTALVGMKATYLATSGVGDITAGGSLLVGSSGSTVAGSLYSDANWGMIIKAKTTTPASADFLFLNSSGTERMRSGTAGLTLAAGFLAPNLATSSAATTGTMCWTSGTGNVNVDTTVTCLSSDERLKEITGSIKSATGKVMALKPITYSWKTGPKLKADPGDHMGLGAFATGYIDESLITRDREGNPRAWRQDAMIALLVAAIQEQQREIEVLKGR